MKYIFLSKQFYTDYDSKEFPEIAHKENRPYIMLLVQIEGVTFAIPFRSHITHNYAFITDSQNHCGIDYTKSIIIAKQIYVLETLNGQPIKIRQNEHKALQGKKYEIIKGLKKYIKDYKRAVKNGANTKVNCFRFSTLQYFHQELGLLTRSEQILNLCKENKTEREIAQILGISHHTVKDYLTQIKRKLKD